MWIAAAEDALLFVEGDAIDQLANAIVPAAPKKLNFGKLRHVLKATPPRNGSDRLDA
jgi:hypothetical protein